MEDVALLHRLELGEVSEDPTVRVYHQIPASRRWVPSTLLLIATPVLYISSIDT